MYPLPIWKPLWNLPNHGPRDKVKPLVLEVDRLEDVKVRDVVGEEVLVLLVLVLVTLEDVEVVAVPVEEVELVLPRSQGV